jgi:hypothetical protein
MGYTLQHFLRAGDYATLSFSVCCRLQRVLAPVVGGQAARSTAPSSKGEPRAADRGPSIGLAPGGPGG